MTILKEILNLKKSNFWVEIINKFGNLKETSPEDWKDPLIIKELGFAYSQLNKHSKAKEIYNHWVNLEPEKAVSHYSLGYIFHDEFFVKNDKFLLEKAISHYNKALELYPAYLVCIFRKGNCLQDLNQIPEAKECFEKVLETYETSQNEDYKKRNLKNYQKAIFNLGKCFQEQKKYEEAENLFKKCLEFYLFPFAKSFIFYNLALCKMAKNHFDEAINLLNLAHKDDPRQEFVLAKIGSCYYLKNDFKNAIRFFSKALEIKNQGYIVFEKGLALWKNGEVEEGKKTIKDALARSTNSKLKHKIYLALAKIELEAGNLQLAEINCKKAIDSKIKEYGFDYAEAHVELAKIYGLQNRTAEAEKETQLALSLKPDLNFSVSKNVSLEVNYS